MKKILLPSISLAIISTVPFLFKEPITGIVPAYIGLSSYLILFLVMLYTVRWYKFKYSNGLISFGKAFKYAFKVTLCYALIGSVIFFVYAKFNEDSLLQEMTNIMKTAQEQKIETQGYVSANYEKTISSMVSIISNPFVISGITFIGYLFWGVIFSLISAAIVKSKTGDIE